MAEFYRLEVVPGVEAYCAALVQPFVNDTHRHVLRVHAAASGRLASAGALAAPFGRRHPFINSHYGRLGHAIADFLGLELPRYSKGPLWTAALAEGGYMRRGRWWYWRMYPEVAQAIRRLGWETSFGGAPMSGLLDDMRANPAADWRISDIERVCREHSVRCAPPSGGGSHYKISHSSRREILTIPFRRPIKAVYIRKLVRFIEAVRDDDADA